MSSTVLSSKVPALPLDQVLPLARDLARKEAHFEDDAPDLAQIALYAYWCAVAPAIKKHVPLVREPWRFAKVVMQRAIWRHYQVQRRGVNYHAVGLGHFTDNPITAASAPTSARAAHHIPDASNRHQLDVHAILAEREFLDDLQRVCGPEPRTVAEALLCPSGDVAKVLIETARRKQSQRRRTFATRPAKAPRGGTESVPVSPRLVREALGMNRTEWSRNLRAVRTFTRYYLAL